MNSRSKVITSGAIAAIIAIALITATLGLGALNSTTGALGSTNTSANTQTGTLAVLLTDPPTVPAGTSAVFITYADIGVHVNGAGNDSGWHMIKTQGQINLMSVINATQTLASANITTGTFNALEFNVTSATVTYNGKNYTADLVYQEHLLYVPIVGGITINEGRTSAAVIDLTPTVLLLGNTTNPTFAFIPAARGYTVPAQSVHLRVGDRDDIRAASWWVAIEHGSHYEVTSASISPTSMSISVTNTGNASIVFRVAAIASTTSVQGGFKGGDELAVGASISEFFVVQPNASLTAITSMGHGKVAQAVAAGGYLLAPGASATFTYSGNITLGNLQLHILQPIQQIISGQKYVITLQGNGMFAQTAVVATPSS